MTAQYRFSAVQARHMTPSEFSHYSALGLIETPFEDWLRLNVDSATRELLRVQDKIADLKFSIDDALHDCEGVLQEWLDNAAAAAPPGRTK